MKRYKVIALSVSTKTGLKRAGEFVTVKAGAAIQVGSLVKILAAGTGAAITTVTPWLVADNTALIAGRFVGKPSGNVVRDDTTPFNETNPDNGDFNVDAAIANEIIEVRVGAN